MKRVLLLGLLMGINDVCAGEIAPLVDRNFAQLDEPIDYPWGKDPFFKEGGHLQTVKSGKTDFQLTAIIYEDGRAVAIINGVIVRENQMIEDRRVKKIAPTYVLLEQENSLLEVQLTTNENGNENADSSDAVADEMDRIESVIEFNEDEDEDEDEGR